MVDLVAAAAGVLQVRVSVVHLSGVARSNS